VIGDGDGRDGTTGGHQPDPGLTRLLSNPTVSLQVCREIAGHVSQVMTDRYSIQRFATKKAAVDALEDRPSQPSPELAPVEASPAAAAPLDLMHPVIQAEIARQVTLAMQQHFPVPPPVPQLPVKKKRTRRRQPAEPQDAGERYGRLFEDRTVARLVMFPGGTPASR
jgi:hypothetical protein